MKINRYRRFTDWDYSKGASLFITISTSPRRPLFGRIEHGIMTYSPLGKVVLAAIEEMPALNAGITLFGHVVMPDHVHFNVHLAAGLPDPLKVLGKAIGRFKVYTTKQAKLMGLVGHSPTIITGHSPTIITEHSPTIINSLNVDDRAAPDRLCATEHSPTIITPPNVDDRAAPDRLCATEHSPTIISPPSVDDRAAPDRLWQQGYHDRLCLTRPFIEATERYIAYNPLKWEIMHGQSPCLRLHEPLESPRFDGNDYWKGVGNISLLTEKICSLRVSREIRTESQINAVKIRMQKAISQGYTILSGFVSPGERAVCEMLCATQSARFIRILPSCLPNVRFKPQSRYVAAFSEKRYLEIAKGNDERDFTRANCLDSNDEIVRMACAGDGLAVYFKADGSHRLYPKDISFSGGSVK